MYYLGIDLGGTNIAVGVVDENCKIVKKGSVPTKAEREADEIIADMAKLCKDLVADCSLTMDDIEYAGIATPEPQTATPESLFTRTTFRS